MAELLPFALLYGLVSVFIKTLRQIRNRDLKMRHIPILIGTFVYATGQLIVIVVAIPITIALVGLWAITFWIFRKK